LIGCVLLQCGGSDQSYEQIQQLQQMMGKFLSLSHSLTLTHNVEVFWKINEMDKIWDRKTFEVGGH